jgi:hypothetical protein
VASAAPATTDAKLVKEMQQREESCMLVLHLTLTLSMTLPVTVTRGAAITNAKLVEEMQQREKSRSAALEANSDLNSDSDC